MSILNVNVVDDKVYSPRHSHSLISDSLFSFLFLYSVNASYSLYWDIVMDWGMMQNPQNMMPESCAGAPITTGSKPQSCAHSVLRSRLRFGASTSIGILLIDTVLRYSWMLRFWEKDLFPNMDTYILCTQFMEAMVSVVVGYYDREDRHI